MTKNGKKEKSILFKIISKFIIFLSSIIILIAIWISYSSLNRISPLKFIPENYTAIIHTDKFYSAVEPLLGLEAAETILSEPSFSSAREPYMKARAFINNATPLMAKIINRRIDTAIYLEEESFISVIDMGYLSSLTRLSHFIAGFLNIKNLTWGNKHFEYKLNETIIYAKPYKNIIMISSSKKSYDFAEKNFTSRIVSNAEKKEIEKNKIKTVKILAPSLRIIKMKIFEKFYNENAEKIFGKENLSSFTFDITNETININLDIPVQKEECNTELTKLLNLKSTQPKFTSFLSSDTQYYTLINIASLEQMKNAFFPLIQKHSDIETTWQKADNLSRTLFSLSLEELLFSWSGNEITAFGIEGSSEPIFAIEIKDEKKRQEIFEKLNNSILINTNTSLIVNGMRLPCLELPNIISNLISFFGVELPRPFYLVNNGYIYFSMAPQNLSSVFTHINRNHIIAKNINWKNVSTNANKNASLELYYNLKRSLPFFLDNTSITAKILKLYGIGKFDFEICEDSIQAKLCANSAIKEDSKMLSGFPKPTGKISDYNLIADNDQNPENLYWIEDDSILKCLNLNSLEQKSIDSFERKIFITSTQEKHGKNNKLWVHTDTGDIYLLDKNLEIVQEYQLHKKLETNGAISNNYYVIPDNTGSISFVDTIGNIEEIFINSDMNIKSSPSVYENYLAIYNRGFEGEIYLFKNKECINRNNPIIIDGIGFGSPAITKLNGKILIGFVTQKGVFYLFEDGNLAEGFPIETGKIFTTNVVFQKNAFYSISEDAVVYRFNLDKTYSCVKIPDISTAKESFISARSFKGTEGIYVCGDSNIIYGFSPSLELLISFPLAGRGVPVFADVNKDKNINCLTLSISREINSWRLK